MLLEVTLSDRSRHSRAVALLWSGIATFLLGQGMNLAWHRGHALERGAGPFHNPGAVLASVGVVLIITAAIVLTVQLRTARARRGTDETSD